MALRRALKLVDDLAVGRTGDHCALTALEDRLGLSPLARRRLQWEIAHAPAPVVALPVRDDDPRRR